MRSKISTALEMIKNKRREIPYAIFRNISRTGLTRGVPDEAYLKIAYRLSVGQRLNIDSPATFSEKLQWLKLNDRRPQYVTMVDKYRVREYISQIIGAEYLIPLLGVWAKAEEIDFDTLPEQFVLKCNHDSGSVIVCKDKSKADRTLIVSRLNKALATKGFWFGREWPYYGVKPVIIAEKYMEDHTTRELRDYKFFCFNGCVRCFKVDFDRFDKHGANYYDREKKLLPFGEECCPPQYDKEIVFPATLDKMIVLAEKLSTGISFLRVDFYSVDEHIYFGELTFFPASGFGRFVPDDWDHKLGNWLKID